MAEEFERKTNKTMNLNLSKKTVLYLLVFVWLVFSVVYIVWDVWADFKNVQMSNAYQQGRIDTINTLIQEGEKCKPVSVAGTEKQIQLIKVDCLETAVEQ